MFYGLGLNPKACSGAAAYVDPSYCPPRMEILWFELSEREVVVWSVIAGAAAGALLGLLVDWMFRRLVPLPATRRGISVVVMVSILAACTGPHQAPPQSPTPEPDLVAVRAGHCVSRVALFHELAHAAKMTDPQHGMSFIQMWLNLLREFVSAECADEVLRELHAEGVH